LRRGACDQNSSPWSLLAALALFCQNRYGRS
jgi:hypothetical protein